MAATGAAEPAPAAGGHDLRRLGQRQHGLREHYVRPGEPGVERSPAHRRRRLQRRLRRHHRELPQPELRLEQLLRRRRRGTGCGWRAGRPADEPGRRFRRNPADQRRHGVVLEAARPGDDQQFELHAARPRRLDRPGDGLVRRRVRGDADAVSVARDGDHLHGTPRGGRCRTGRRVRPPRRPLPARTARRSARRIRGASRPRPAHARSSPTSCSPPTQRRLEHTSSA